MAVIEEKEKKEMEFLKEMRKDDREHELKLQQLQILGQMIVPQQPHSPSLYYPPPPASQPSPIPSVTGGIGMGYAPMTITETDTHNIGMHDEH